MKGNRTTTKLMKASASQGTRNFLEHPGSLAEGCPIHPHCNDPLNA